MSAKDWAEIFEWRVDDDGVTITKFLQKNATSVDVPSEIDGKPVVAIGDFAFSGCRLRQVSLPEGLQTIGDGAFYWCSLTKVSFPKGLQTIGKRAFYWCGSLTKVSFPKGLQTIGEEAFCDCKSLDNVSLPKGVKIGKNVFGRELPPEFESQSSRDPYYWAERGGVYADWGNPF